MKITKKKKEKKIHIKTFYLWKYVYIYESLLIKSLAIELN